MALNPSALNFGTSGNTRHVKLPTTASIKGLENFTWMADVKVNASTISQFQRLYMERQGTGALIRFAVTPYKGKLRFEFSPKDGTADTNYDFSYDWDDRWHHVGFTARVSGDTPQYQIYLDGNQVAEGALVRPSGTTAISDTVPLGGSIFMGNHSLHTSGGEVFDPARYWFGKVDNVYVFNEVKNQSEMLQYRSVKDHPEDVETPPVTDDSILYAWRFNENTGTSTTDTKGSKVGNLFTSNAASSALWTIDRPWLGNKTDDTTAPSVPTIIGSTSVSADRATMIWSPSTDNIFVQYYELQLATLSDFSTATSYILTDVLYMVKGLINNTNYYWRVRAYDAAGNASAWTSTQSFTTVALGDTTEPNRPTGLNATSVSHSSFILNWVSSTSPDVIGYKIDVAIDPNFKNYITGFRNLRIGNVNTYPITGTSPLTNYYARMRAFDEAENESINSTVLIVQTPNRPDITPPLAVNAHNASAITGTEATLSWDEGVDDQEILSYQIDVAYDDAFTQYVTTQDGVLWQARSVGNVLGYRIQHLYPETGYFYRVRAVDTSSNVSDNPDDSIAFSTLPSSVNAGGYREYVFEPTKDAYVAASSPTTNFGTATTLSTAGNGSTNTFVSFLGFDTSSIQGTIVSAMLRIFVSDASTLSTAVRTSTTTEAWTETGVNWNNQPSSNFSNYVEAIPLTVGTWLEYDITSILPTTAGSNNLTVRLAASWQTDQAVFHSREGINHPQLVLQTDITNTTTVYDMQFTPALGNRVNWFANPTFETATTGWGSSGAGGVTLSRMTDTPHSGTGYLNIAYTAVAGTKSVHTSSLTTIPANVGETWTFTAYVRASAANTTNVTLRLSERGAAGADLGASTAVTIPVTTSWARFSVTRTITSATVQYILPIVEYNGSGAYTLKIDSLLIEKSPVSGAVFSGNTPGATWNGTVNESTSRIGATSFSYVTPYSGDTNQNNDATTYIKYRSQTEFDQFPTVKTNDRTLKKITTIIPASYGSRNLVANPSFENDTTGWSVSPGTLTRDEDVSNWGGASAKIAYTGVSSPIFTSARMPVFVGVPVSARLDFFGPLTLTATLHLRSFDAAGTLLGSSATVAGESVLNGNGTDWLTLFISSYTPPATAATVEVFLILLDTSGPWNTYIDGVQVTPIVGKPNYFDATFPGGVWEGVEHNSISGVSLPGNITYDVQQTVVDLDGVTNAGALATFTHNGEFIAGTFPDDLTTVGDMTFETNTNAITMTLPYTGDDNANMMVRVEWKRVDLSSWSRANASIRRTAKQIVSTVPDLLPGSEYQFKVTIIDPDGANNTLVGLSGEKYVLGSAITQSTFASVTAPSRISFGGFVLQGRPDQKIGVTRHSGAFGLPNRRLQVSDLPRGHGAVELLDLWGSRTVSLTGFVEGNTRAELDDNLQALKQAFARGRQRLTIDTLSERARYFFGTCESFAVSEEGGENYRHLMWDAEIVCADPFGYASDLSQTNETNLINGGQIAVFNAGDIEAEPLIRVRTTRFVPITFFIFNRQTGERIKPETTIVSSDRVIIDTTKKSVLKNGVEIEYVGSFPTLAPGENTFQVELVSKESAASVYVELSWRARYL